MLDEKVKQRIELALNFQESDRVPVCDFIDNLKVFRYFSGGEYLSLEEKVKAYHELGIDVCWHPEKRQSRRHGFLERLQKFALREPRLHVFSQEETAQEMEEYLHQKKIFEPFTYLSMAAEGCLSVAYRAMGFEIFCQKMYTEIIEIEKLIEIFAENLYQRAEAFSRRQEEGLFFVVDHIAYPQGLIFSRDFLRRQWVPRIKNAISPLKEKKIKVILHSQGKLADLIPDIIDAGFDGIHPLEQWPDLDISVLKKNYAQKLILCGNVQLSASDPEQIVRDAQKSLHCAAPGGGYFIGSKSGITKNIELKDIFAFFSAVKEFGNFPINPPN